MYNSESKPLTRTDIDLAVKAACDAVAQCSSGQLSEEECRKRCLLSLRVISPERRKITLDGGTRTKLTTARFDVLLSCIQQDANLALKLLAGEDSSVPAYRQAERLFRSVTESSAGQGTGLVHDIREAVTIGGAIDLGPTAPWRVCNGGDGTMPAGVLEVCPPAPLTPLQAEAEALAGSSLPARCTGGIYTFTSRPGLYVLPSCLDGDTQRSLILSILNGYIERPNRRNIDAAVDPDESNRDWAASHGQDVSTLGGSAAGGRAGAGYACGLWQQYMEQAKGREQGNKGAQLPLEKLTWATLGYQYDWTARAYHTPGDEDYARHAASHALGRAAAAAGEEASCTRWQTPFPADLHALSAQLMSEVDALVRRSPLLSGKNECDWDCSATGPPPVGVPAHGLPLTLDGQAGIVNLYPATSKLPMGGHKDGMERTHAAPVLSLSLGCAAVFLAGGHSKDVQPIALLLRSGDCLVLAGASRLALHGVARVFDGTSPSDLFQPGMTVTHATAGQVGTTTSSTSGSGIVTAVVDEALAGVLGKYLAGHRLNINVRQVLPSAGDKRAA